MLVFVFFALLSLSVLVPVLAVSVLAPVSLSLSLLFLFVSLLSLRPSQLSLARSLSPFLRLSLFMSLLSLSLLSLSLLMLMAFVLVLKLLAVVLCLASAPAYQLSSGSTRIMSLCAGQQDVCRESESTAWSKCDADGKRDMQIFLRTLSGKTVVMCVEASESISDLMVEIERREGIPREVQRLVHAGRQLESHRTLADAEPAVNRQPRFRREDP